MSSGAPNAPGPDGHDDSRRAVRHSTLVVLGGQLERVLGTMNAVALRWGLRDPGAMGVYTGLRLYLDNTNRSSLGVSLGAAQEIPILRAGGKREEADRLADVAFSVNFVTSLLYASGLLAYVAWRTSTAAASGDPYARLWTGGLIAMALLAPLKRYQDFLIVLLRTRQEFLLTTSLQILETVVFTVLMVAGLWLAGFWGLLAAIGLVMAFNIAYIHLAHPLQLKFRWDWPTTWRLFKVGLPIWANTLLLIVVSSLDRIVLLWMADEPERSTGLYTVAVMGTSWANDLAGRIVLVMYTYFQTTLGRTNDPIAVARQAAGAAEAQAPLLFAGSAVAYVCGPAFLARLFPEYAPGVPAMRPLLPAMILLGLTWGPRQLLITVGRLRALGLATLLGGLATLAAAVVGLRARGIVGVSWGMSLGYAVFYLAITLAAYLPTLGAPGWLAHHAHLLRSVAWHALGAALAAHLPLPIAPGTIPDFVARAGLIAAWELPTLWAWGRRHRWGGLLDRWLGRQGG